MKLRNAVLILICVCVTFLLCSCALLISKFKVETKDLNGEDDYSLNVFTDEDICAEDNDSYCLLFGLGASGSKSYEDEDYLHDGDTVEAFASTPFSGVSCLQVTYGTAETITFTVECNRTKGNMRIVLLDENYDIIYDFSVTKKSSFTVNNAKGKEFEIRVAGESAEFNVNAVRVFKDE